MLRRIATVIQCTVSWLESKFLRYIICIPYYFSMVAAKFIVDARFLLKHVVLTFLRWDASDYTLKYLKWIQSDCFCIEDNTVIHTTLHKDIVQTLETYFKSQSIFEFYISFKQQYKIFFIHRSQKQLTVTVMCTNIWLLWSFGGCSIL